MDKERIESLLVKIECNLGEHMRRTRAAEKRLDIIEVRLLEQGRSIARGQGAITAIGVLSGTASLAMIVLELWPS